MVDADRNFALKTAATPLVIATWLLLTAYLTVPSPAPMTYRLATLRNAKRQTDKHNLNFGQ